MTKATQEQAEREAASLRLELENLHVVLGNRQDSFEREVLENQDLRKALAAERAQKEAALRNYEHAEKVNETYRQALGLIGEERDALRAERDELRVEMEEAEQKLQEAERLAEKWWETSQLGRTVINLAGIMQTCAEELRAVLRTPPSEVQEKLVDIQTTKGKFLIPKDMVGDPAPNYPPIGREPAAQPAEVAPVAKEEPRLPTLMGDAPPWCRIGKYARAPLGNLAGPFQITNYDTLHEWLTLEGSDKRWPWSDVEPYAMTEMVHTVAPPNTLTPIQTSPFPEVVQRSVARCPYPDCDCSGCVFCRVNHSDEAREGCHCWCERRGVAEPAPQPPATDGGDTLLGPVEALRAEIVAALRSTCRTDLCDVADELERKQP